MDEASRTHLIASHPALKRRGLAGSAGFSPPRIKDPIVVDLEPGSDALAELGFVVKGRAGRNNRLICDRRCGRTQFTLNLAGVDDNLLVVGTEAELRGELSFESSGNIAVLGGGWYSFGARFLDGGAALFCGEDTSFGGGSIWLEGDTAVHIGDSALFAWEINIFTGDSHAMFDAETLEVLNRPCDIIVGPQVWVGLGSLLLKGAEIGSGSIVAAKSMVNGKIPPRCLAAGAPARVVRRNVSYTRARRPDRGSLVHALSRSEPFLDSSWSDGSRPATSPPALKSS
jgi:acetyltransferase-like isoleucine patch superfamily enzyme